MKQITILSLSFVLFILSSCISHNQNYNFLKDATSRNNTLMPFEKNGTLGYIDSETLEIIITEQYLNAKHFVGDFAVVEKKEGKPYVIDNKNIKIIGTFDHIALFDTENSEIVFALVGENTDYQWNEYSRSDFFPTTFPRRNPSKINYYLYNLNTGKMVMKLGKGNYPNIDEDIPRIRIFGNYILYDLNSGISLDRDVKHLYEINNDGSVIESKISIDEFIEKLIKENNLKYINKDFNFDDEYTYDSWFGYFNTFDINRLIEQLPENTGISIDYHDWRYEGDKPTLYIRLLSDMTHPLQDKLLFQVYLKENKNGERFVEQYDGGKSYTGLYSASTNRWEVLPVEGWGYFFYGTNDDWIIYDDSLDGDGNGDSFYNIKTRKKYTNTYIVLHSKYYGISSPMAYCGYSERKEDSLVEDF
jgi:hypothetical protein